MQKGYTLIEIMVAVGIFFIIIASPTGFFVGSLKAQQKVLSSQELIDNMSYGLEYMSRALRMAKKDDIDGINCLAGTKVNYELTHSGNGIKFRNYNDQCQEFYLDLATGRIKEDRTGYSEPLFLTSDDTYIEVFEISLVGETQLDDLQPKVTMFFEVKGSRSGKEELQPLMKLQTTISQRNLDVTY